MVDAEDLLLAEAAQHRVVDLAIRLQVVAQRLLQHDARGGRVQAGGGELFAHGGEQRRRRGHVHHHHVGIALLQPVRQAAVVLRLGQVQPQELQQLGEARELFLARALGQVDLRRTSAG
jgi:hypothetical protein